MKIKLRFLCVFRIDCTEGGGQVWEGKSYKINDEGNFLSGLYVWNPKQKERPDIGEHKLYFSEDRNNVNVRWHNLTFDENQLKNKKDQYGIVDWKKVKPNK